MQQIACDVDTLLDSNMYAVLDKLGINRWFRFYHRRSLTVLCYHAVVERIPVDQRYRFRNAVSLDQFRVQLKIVRKYYNPVSLESVQRWSSGRTNLPVNPLLITFDDGFRNNLTIAAPELIRLNIPAVFYITTGYIDTERILWPQEIDEIVSAWNESSIPLPGCENDAIAFSKQEWEETAKKVRYQCKTVSEDVRRNYLNRIRSEPLPNAGQNGLHELYRFMSWDEVRELKRQGFEIGSHTVEHPILSKTTDEQLIAELAESKTILENQLQAECNSIAYPNGGASDVSESVFRSSRSCGYTTGFTLNGALTSAMHCNPLAIGRTLVHRNLPLFIATASGMRSKVKNQ